MHAVDRTSHGQHKAHALPQQRTTHEAERTKGGLLRGTPPGSRLARTRQRCSCPCTARTASQPKTRLHRSFCNLCVLEGREATVRGTCKNHGQQVVSWLH